MKKVKKRVKTTNLKLGPRGAASKAVKALFINILRSLTLNNSKNKSNTHTQTVSIVWVNPPKGGKRMVFTYKCTGSLKPKSSVKEFKTKKGIKK